MKLSRLRLKNFKGVKDFTLNAGCLSINIYGDNGAGKTTICDALNWLLFCTDSNFKSQFNIKPIEKSGEQIHGLNSTVEGVFIIPDGEITLKKSYREQWVKRRGDSHKQLTGHTTDHWFDGVPVKLKDFNERVGKIFDPEMFKLLSSPLYFSEMPWKNRRDLLVEICGDVTDLSIVDAKPELKGLLGIIHGKTIDDHKKIISAKQAEINKEIERIPVRIDESQRGLPDVSDTDSENEKNTISDCEKLIVEKEELLLSISSGFGIDEKKRELKELNSEMLIIKNRIINDHQSNNNKSKIAYENAKESYEKSKISVSQAENDIDEIKSEILLLESNINIHRESWTKTNESVFLADKTDSLCQSCGQTIPESTIKEVYQKALSEFRLKKSEELASIVDQANRHKSELTKKKVNLDEKEKWLIVLEAENDNISTIFEQAQKHHESCKNSEPNFLENDDYIEIFNRYSIVMESVGKDEPKTEALKINAEIEELKKEIRKAEWKLTDIERVKKAAIRKKELEGHERTLSAEFERLEGELFMIETFIRTKVELLEENINKRFKIARFKMFNHAINGGLNECCDVLCAGVPFGSGLNTGSRINVGLDIIRTFQQHYGVEAPIFIDNAESITDLLDIGSQIIRLEVSKGCDSLLVEGVTK